MLNVFCCHPIASLIARRLIWVDDESVGHNKIFIVVRLQCSSFYLNWFQEFVDSMST